MKHAQAKKTVNKKVLIGVAIGILVLIAVLIAARTLGTKSSNDEKPISSVLSEVGNGTDVESWLNELDEDQMAAIDIAYEASVAEGYTGSKEEWVASEVRSYIDSNGQMVVLLPDGGEFVVATHKGADSSPAESSDGSSAEGSNAQEQGAEEQSDEESTEGQEGDAASDESSDEASQDEGQADSESVAPSIRVNNVQAHKGDKSIAVPIRIEDNPGVLGLTFSVSYDESALTLTKAENGEAFAGALTMTHSREYTSGCLFTWDGVELAEKDVKDGTILTLYFDVSSKASGVYPVALRGLSAFDSNLNSIKLTVADGNVAVG